MVFLLRRNFTCSMIEIKMSFLGSGNEKIYLKNKARNSTEIFKIKPKMTKSVISESIFCSLMMPTRKIKHGVRKIISIDFVK